MSYKILDECIACDACLADCPNDAISEGDPIYVIDAKECSECQGVYDSPMCVMLCPVDAIVLDT